MLRLILARHGVTEWNADGRYQGHQDIPLNDLGRRQAECLAERLAGETIHAIYSSDLSRAYETAVPVAARHNLPIQREARLREIDYGVFSGLSREQIHAQYPDEFAAWRVDRNAAPPGGETLAAFASRVVAFLDEIRAKHADETLLLVAHGGPLRQLICRALDLPPDRQWRVSMDNASLSEVHLHADGGGVLYMLNDTHHLDEISAGSLAMGHA